MHMFNRIYRLLALLSFMTLANLASAELKGINPAEVQTLIDQGVTVIDIRRPDEWQQTGIIPGSKTLMFFDRQGQYNTEQWVGEFRQWVSQNDQPVVLVCRSGNRTGKVGQFLSDQLAMSQVYHLEGGITAWQGEQRDLTAP